MISTKVDTRSLYKQIATWRRGETRLQDVVAGRVSGNNEHVVRRNTIRPLELDILALKVRPQR